ncbi:SRRM2 protein homolog rsr-2-like [Oppia nitens]|uniref:SRRM2 protein homolog rsr-2-like n=1 Tax=Oppia nitens TaxID=1686743 RepID=UPI0023DA831F|nr:SRRM2 protein homolog rsr-2-like [Oppia nitens]
MYNGIGLNSARGSGTNGYVQKNLSFVKAVKDKFQYKSEDDFKRLERELCKVPNKDILEHQNKRQIELKCLQMQDNMEMQGFSPEEIETKVREFRETLMKQKDRQKEDSSKRRDLVRDWFREESDKNVKETHKLAEMNHKKNDNLKNALRINSNFIEGSSLDPTRKAKEALAREAEKQKRYAIIPEPLDEPVIKVDENKSKIKEKRKERSHKKRYSDSDGSDSKNDSDSDSESSDDSSKRKRKNKSKHRKSSKKRKSSKNNKSKDKTSKKRKYSNSSSSDSDSGSESSSNSDSDSSDSSSSSYHKSRNGHKKSDSKKDYRQRPKRRSYSKERDDYNPKSTKDYKDSTHKKDNNNESNKTSRLIEMNIKQMRKEAENTLIEKSNDKRNERTKDVKKNSSPPPRHRSYSRSKSRTSVSSEDEPKSKRLKSTVVETNPINKNKEIPKSYLSHHENKRSHSRNDRSVSADRRSRHSSHSNRSRSSSVRSNDSRHSNKSYSSSKSDSSESLPSRKGSRSPSIPRRKGSPSFLEKRRITRY